MHNIGHRAGNSIDLHKSYSFCTLHYGYGMSKYVHTRDIMSIYGRRCVSFEKEWIENRDIKEELQEDLDELYGGTVWFICL